MAGEAPPPYNQATQNPPLYPSPPGAVVQGQTGQPQQGGPPPPAQMMIPMTQGQPMMMAPQYGGTMVVQPGQVAPVPYGMGAPVQEGMYQQPMQGVYQQPLPGQPQPAQWMPIPQGVAGCPPGLEYLSMIDQVLCHQKIELIEAFTSWESKNRYVIKNSMGQQIYFAFEDSDLCMRQCCGAQREFTMHIVDNMEQEVMKIYRPFKFCGGNCWFASLDMCSHEVHVESPPGTLIASIHQTMSLMNFEYEVKDANGEVQLRIVGPCCCMMGIQCIESTFEVLTPNGEEIGMVQRQFSGLVKELFTEADNFGVTFPLDLDVKMKAALLGATFLITTQDFFAQDDTNSNFD